MSPKAVALINYVETSRTRSISCLVILQMIAYMYLEEFAAIALVSFQVNCY